MNQGDTHASDVGSPSVSAPQHAAVSGFPAIVYTDAIGWTSISWSPRSDLLLAVTGFKASYDQIEALAAKAVVQ